MRAVTSSKAINSSHLGQAAQNLMVVEDVKSWHVRGQSVTLHSSDGGMSSSFLIILCMISFF